MITVSIVSHRHGEMVSSLLSDLGTCCATDIEVILTLNVAEAAEIDTSGLASPLQVVRNAAPQGFGGNHNAAFRLARGEYFCVVNPDIRIRANPFPALLEALRDPRVAVAAPVVRNPAGEIEDSARRFPTPSILLRKLGGARPAPDYALTAPIVFPDWVAGMFMLFRREAFSALGGFDERYFLYYEDVDICARARSRGMEIALATAASVTHHAQRASHRNLQHALWHARSALRYFTRARPPRSTRQRPSTP